MSYKPMERLERVAMCLFMDQYQDDTGFTKGQKKELQQIAFLDWPYLSVSERSKWLKLAQEKLEKDGVK